MFLYIKLISFWNNKLARSSGPVAGYPIRFPL